MYEIKKIEHIENIISNDLYLLAHCYVNSIHSEIMLFPEKLQSEYIYDNNNNNPYHITKDEMRKPLKELLPRFINTIDELEPIEPLDENKMFAYLTYYSDFVK